jgi:BirA family transcriptional regulator, biotin operon repressor / biotin---[acetyl-CoA-carboxylase] ligase
MEELTSIPIRYRQIHLFPQPTHRQSRSVDCGQTNLAGMSTLDYQHLEQAIASRGDIPKSVRVRHFESVSSTNDVLWQAMARGETGTYEAIVADRQTGGKGQRGRQWESLSGGLYLSMALEPHLPPQQIGLLPLAMAWGIATELRTAGIPVCLKWPNDLLLESAKLGGILTETRTLGSRVTQAVVGVGINWQNQPPAPGIALATYLATAPNSANLLPWDRELLVVRTIAGILKGNDICQPETIDFLLTDYVKLLDPYYHQVSIADCSSHSEMQLGRVLGIAPTGELRVEKPTKTNPSGEICFSPDALSLGYRAEPATSIAGERR